MEVQVNSTLQDRKIPSEACFSVAVGLGIELTSRDENWQYVAFASSKLEGFHDILLGTSAVDDLCLHQLLHNMSHSKLSRCSAAQPDAYRWQFGE
ncbi:hypothetical protein M8818_005453 [Zalaria obscura]|uniref:Uncharacterized protein n=1 Tax=Zalaria obscura TaxID=2024903 RepID=A0ACC3S8Y7_9PEZI